MIVADADAAAAAVVHREAAVAVAVAVEVEVRVTTVLLAKIIRLKKPLIAKNLVARTMITANAKMARVTKTKTCHRKLMMPPKAKALLKPPPAKRTKPKLSTKNAPTPIANAITPAKTARANATEEAVTAADASAATIAEAAIATGTEIAEAAATTVIAISTEYCAARSTASATASNQLCETSTACWARFKKPNANVN